MSDLVEKFGQHIDKKIARNPETARKELLFGYRAFDLKLKYAPDKRLSPSRRLLADICMKEHIRSFANAGNSALVSVFLPCEIVRAFGMSTIFAEGFSGYMTGAYAEKAFVEAAENAGIAETYCGLLRSIAKTKIYHKYIPYMRRQQPDIQGAGRLL